MSDPRKPYLHLRPQTVDRSAEKVAEALVESDDQTVLDAFAGWGPPTTISASCAGHSLPFGRALRFGLGRVTTFTEIAADRTRDIAVTTTGWRGSVRGPVDQIDLSASYTLEADVDGARYRWVDQKPRSEGVYFVFDIRDGFLIDPSPLPEVKGGHDD